MRGVLYNMTGKTGMDGGGGGGCGSREEQTRGRGGGGVEKSRFERAFQSAGDCQISCQKIEDAFSAKQRLTR